MVIARRLPEGRGYRVRFQELPARSLSDEAALNQAIEAEVRRCPEQYLWSYFRYKVPRGVEAPPAVREMRES
jgi:KDO2-lipid IV(A) lauroyltransferase